MTNKKSLLLLLLFLIAPAVFAQLDLPPAIKKIQDYNEQYASGVLRNVSFIIAFLAGIATIFSPCILPLLPAFFAFTFKEKKEITKMTLLFFLGFAIMFIIMGLAASSLGIASTVFFQGNISSLVTAAGIIIILLGVLTIFGFGFSGLVIKKKMKHDGFGIFVYGLLFTVGWTACVGPILSGILLITAIFRNYAASILLMFFYSLGIFVPLLVIALLYDKYNLKDSKLIKGKEFQFEVFNKKLFINSTKLISGLLLIFTGFLFLIFKGTSAINQFDIFGTKQWFFSIQDILIKGGIIYNIAGAIVLIILLYLIYKILKNFPPA